MIALNYSYKVIEDIRQGNYNKALRHSNLSRKFNIYSTVCWSFGITITIIYVTLVYQNKLTTAFLPLTIRIFNF